MTGSVDNSDLEVSLEPHIALVVDDRNSVVHAPSSLLDGFPIPFNWIVHDGIHHLGNEMYDSNKRSFLRGLGIKGNANFYELGVYFGDDVQRRLGKLSTPPTGLFAGFKKPKHDVYDKVMEMMG